MAAYGSGYYGKGVYGIGNVVISGNSATVAVGTVLASRSIQEDGTIATGNVGTVGIDRTVAITGNAATLAVGSVFVSPIITGNAATGAVGTVVGTVVYSKTSQVLRVQGRLAQSLSAILLKWRSVALLCLAWLAR